MKPIIEEIFYGNIGGIPEKSSFPKKKLDTELKAYYSFYNTLSDEQKANYTAFYDLLVDRHSYEMQEAYSNGFKTGALIALEISGFTFPKNGGNI